MPGMFVVLGVTASVMLTSIVMVMEVCMSRELLVFVPRSGVPAERMIDAGSAIVGADVRADGNVEVYYEGNRLGAENLRRYEDRLLVAGGRLAQRYPTIARALVPADDLVLVGTLDAGTWRFAPHTHAESEIARWVGADWRRPDSEQLGVDQRTWERVTGKRLIISMASLDEGDLATMTPLLRAAVERMVVRR